MKKWLFIPIILSVHLSAFAQVDSVSISVHTEDGSAFQKREKFKYLRRSMIDEPRLWKITLQPSIASTSKSPTDQHLANFFYDRKLYRYFDYGISNKIGYEMKIRKVVSIMPELLTTYSFRGREVSTVINFSMRYYVGQKRAMALGKTGNNLLASYLEARVDEIFGFYSWTFKIDDTHESRSNTFGVVPHSLTLSYGVQKRHGKFGFFDVSAGANLNFSSGSISHGFYFGEIHPAIKLSWGFATPPRRLFK